MTSAFFCTFFVRGFITSIFYINLFPISEYSKPPVFHPGGFNVFFTQPLRISLPHLFSHCDDTTTSLFRNVSPVILSVYPYHLCALLRTFVESEFLNMLYNSDTGVSIFLVRRFYPVLENDTSSSRMSRLMQAFFLINLQNSGGH
jgi:hypothetical protein